MSDGVDQTQMERPTYREELGRRLSAVLDRLPSRQKAAETAGRSTDMLNKYERGVAEAPFMAMANLCLAAGVRMEWLATGLGDVERAAQTAPDQASQPLRREDLMMAMQLASEALGNKVLSPPDHAELVSLLYELLVEGLPQATVLRYAKRAARV